MEEVPDRAPRHHRRAYKIQEVIKRRQVMLVQVVKEERGTKGAALTTYLSLAGRYCVLMPNTARGGGISRKITSADDRKKLREIAEELDVPEGMGVILRTAGAARTKQEVKRDFEYLLRIWEQVRDLTLKSSAPTLVYEEGSLAKRSIRDLYTKDIEEIIVAGETGYRDAKEFMRMLMPSHAKNVKLYADTQQPVFTRYGIESQLDAMFSPTVQLKSGGYIVINQTEALVSIDVNSGRSTREHHIEDTALKTNCEAAEEVARQLRLRDLAGLIVIDFIDMDEKRNNRTVERRMKDALRNDRARIQVGRISHFGLLEMSRQRIRTSVLESSTDKCPHCGGTGHMRSVSSVALQLLRALEETLLKAGTHNQIVRTRPEIALYVLNHKRPHLMALEQRFHISIAITSDATIGGQPGFTVDRGEQVMTPDQAKAIAAQALASAPPQLIEEEEPDHIERRTSRRPPRSKANPPRRPTAPSMPISRTISRATSPRRWASRASAAGAGGVVAAAVVASRAASTASSRRLPPDWCADLAKRRPARCRRATSNPISPTPESPAKAVSHRSRTWRSQRQRRSAAPQARPPRRPSQPPWPRRCTASRQRQRSAARRFPRRRDGPAGLRAPARCRSCGQCASARAGVHAPARTFLRCATAGARRRACAQRAAGAAPPLNRSRARAGVQRKRSGAGADAASSAGSRAGAGGDLGQRRRRQAAQDRLVGQTPSGWRQELRAQERAQQRCRAAGTIATHRRPSIVTARLACRAIWRFASTPRVCSAAIPSSSCTAAATPPSSCGWRTSPATTPTCCASRAPAPTWRRSSRPAFRRCGLRPCSRCARRTTSPTTG